MLFTKRKKKVDSKEIGLEAGLLFLKFFLKTDYLHYGYFGNGLEPDIANLKKAQEQYTEMLISHIPDNVKRILDVGCGSGKTALQLVERGYEVDCVSPGNVLTNYAKELVGDQVNIFQCKFENLENDKKYDLILFSESFQYIPMDKSIPMALERLNQGGYIMVCDFFKTDPEKKSELGGGHDFVKWLTYKDSYPIETLIEKDITAETAPTIEIAHQFTTTVIKPIWTSLWALGEDRFPYVVKLARKMYGKKIKKKEARHFNGARTGENFIKYKKYMFYLFQAAGK